MKQPNLLVGRCFVHPLFDYLLIGGGLSLIAICVVYLLPDFRSIVDEHGLPYLFLISNNAHFAASTVRLYTKPGTSQSLPFLTMALPLVMLVLLVLALANADVAGHYIQTIYLTWSPYHYAAQAYGLSVMYCYRSGCQLSIRNKRLLFWAAMMPFIHNVTYGASGTGLALILPKTLLTDSWLSPVLLGARVTAIALSVILPTLVTINTWKNDRRIPPAISWLTLITNSIWWFVLSPLNAFVWATIFHGIQYLAIVVIFHVRDQLREPGNRHGAAYHTMLFYGISLGLGYALFSCLPLFFIFSGFGAVESMLLVVAAINLHHFIVDAYIWRLGSSDSNRRVVQGFPAASAVPTE